MANNLIDNFKSSFADTLIRECSGMFGEAAQSISSSLDAIVPAIFGSVIMKVNSDQGARPLLDFIVSNGLTDTEFNPSGTEELMAKGTGVLNYLLGNQLSPLVDSISAIGGLKTSSASSLLKIVAPLLLGFFGRTVKEKSLNSSETKDFLLSQFNLVKQNTPGALSHLLGYPDETPTPSSVSNHEMMNSNPPTGMSKVMPWIILLLTSLGLFYFLQKGCNTPVPGVKMTPTEMKDTI